MEPGFEPWQSNSWAQVLLNLFLCVCSYPQTIPDLYSLHWMHVYTVFIDLVNKKYVYNFWCVNLWLHQPWFELLYTPWNSAAAAAQYRWKLQKRELILISFHLQYWTISLELKLRNITESRFVLDLKSGTEKYFCN